MHTIAYLHKLSKWVWDSLRRCNASRFNNGAQIFITVRQLFLALCFYTTKHRLKCHRLRFESETKCSESSRDERWTWSDLPLQEKKKFCLKVMKWVIQYFRHLVSCWRWLPLNSPAGRTMQGYTFNMRWGFPGLHKEWRERGPSDPIRIKEEGAVVSAAKTGAPDHPLPDCFHHLLWEDTEAFPSQVGDVISPTCPGSALGSLPFWIWGEASSSDDWSWWNSFYRFHRCLSPVCFFSANTR